MSTRVARGVFLDRDGTIVVDRHYIARPAEVTLLPGAANAIRALNDAGIPVIVATNQSGIARGLLSEYDFDRVQDRVSELLAQHGAHLTASYHCPHHPGFSGTCDCRKPGTAMYEAAAREQRIDLARSLYIGDRWHDVQPALTLGGRGILVPSPETPAAEIERARREATVAESISAALVVWDPSLEARLTTRAGEL